MGPQPNDASSSEDADMEPYGTGSDHTLSIGSLLAICDQVGWSDILQVDKGQDPCVSSHCGTVHMPEVIDGNVSGKSIDISTTIMAIKAYMVHMIYDSRKVLQWELGMFLSRW